MATFLSAEGLLVAAPPTLLRQGLLHTLREAWPDCPVRFTTDPTQLPGLLRQQPYRLVIIDDTALSMALLPALLGQVRDQHPALPLLVLTSRRRTLLPTAMPGLRLLPHHSPPADVALAAAELLAPPAVPRPAWPTRRHAAPGAGFSLRELQVLALVIADLCNEQIATQLRLSVRTVESHRRTLLQKAGVRTPVGLVVRALREGWVAA